MNLVSHLSENNNLVQAHLMSTRRRNKSTQLGPSYPSQTLRHDKVQSAKGGLKYVLNRANELLVIESVVSETIDSDLPGEVKVASFELGILHLSTSSASLATRIKYSQRNLIARLKRIKKPILIDSIKVSVQPKNYQEPFQNLPPIPPSKENGELLKTSAQYIEDEPLREALIKLSKHTEPN
ncbi:MAG: hypothetical protein ACI9FB_002341 [Candidatus Azotimanducaceae bacterium]